MPPGESSAYPGASSDLHGGAGGGPRDPARPGSLSGRLLSERYLLGDLIASGGMATVYEAVDVRLDREVAVKVMHASLGDTDAGATSFVDRFVREARAAARLSHTGIVAVHDQGTDAGVTYLVMELVRGTTLRAVIRDEAPVRATRALALLEPVVAAVAAAHRGGIVHRDVKPENVLIADDGHIKVADFGLARAIDAEAQNTTTGGILIGTVSYLAPELVVDGTADARADVYALGVVLYELLTGSKPHQGESPIQIAYRHVHADVPAPSLVVDGIPPYLDALVARATSRDRDQRPADASILLHHLRRVRLALAEGLADDPDLTADLLPRRTEDEQNAEASAGFDTADLEDLRGDGFADAELYPALANASPLSTAGDAGDVTARLDLDAPASRGSDAEVPGPPGDTDEAASSAEDEPRRRGPLIVGLFVVLALVAAGLYGWSEWRTVAAPRLLDLTQEEATERAESAGFTVEVGPAAYSENVEAGLVLATDPEGGADIVRGGTITLTISQGPERYTVPALEGRSGEEAQTLLADSNLVYTEGEPAYSEEIAEGDVISTDPAAGTIVRRDDEITVVLSLGRRPIDVTDFTGQPADEAEAALTNGSDDIDGDELQVEIVEEFSDTVEDGIVISQDPATGTLYRGDTVTLTVSKGPETVTIPDGLVGLEVDDARAQLEDLGLVVETTSLIGGAAELGYVVELSPGSGEVVERGSTVTLTVL